MKIIFLGDIVSRLGREAVKDVLLPLKKKEKIALAFANAENLSGGRGVTRDKLYEMLEAGVDYFTSGNHVFRLEGWQDILADESCRILRPANYPDDIPGRGWAIIENPPAKPVLLINLMGKSFFNCETVRTLTCPFRTLEKILDENSSQEFSAIIVDLHAEGTSEKQALGFFFDGKISLLAGTHTHVPTANARVLPEGSGFVTDIGMVGPLNSVLGVKKEIIWDLMRFPQPQTFQWVKKGPAVFQSVIADIDSQNSCRKIYRHDEILENANP